MCNLYLKEVAIKKSNNKKNEVFILGSGFSKAIHKEMPLLNDLTDAVLESLKKGPPVWKRIYDEILTFGRLMYVQSAKSSQALNFEELLTFLYQDFPWKSDEAKYLSRGLYFHVVEVASEVIKKRQRTLSKNKLSQSDIKNFLWYLHFNESKVITLNYDTILEDSAIYLLKPWIHQDNRDIYMNIFYIIDKNEKFTNENNRIFITSNKLDNGANIYIYNYESISKKNFEDALKFDSNYFPSSLRKIQISQLSLARSLYQAVYNSLFDSKLDMEYFFPIPIAPVASRTPGLLGGPHYRTFEILKLHGSVNWFFPGEGDVSGQIYFEHTDRKNDRRYTMDLAPLIIPPVLDKSKFFAHNTMKSLWVLARKYLETADKLYLIGYSIPETDLTVKMMLQNVVKDDCEIFIINKDENDIDRYKRLFSGKKLNTKFIKDNNRVFNEFINYQFTPQLPSWLKTQ